MHTPPKAERTRFVTAPFTDADWPQFDGFAREHFGQSHNRRPEFNRHWFGPDQCGRWNVRKVMTQDTGQLTGLMMLIVADAKFGGQTAPLAWISNAAIVPEAQEAGIGAQLYFWAYKSNKLVGALSGNENSDPINDVLARDIPGTRMERYLWVHQPDRALEFCRDTDQEEVKTALQQRFTRPLMNASDIEVRSVSQLGPEFEDLWQSFSDGLFFCVNRSRDFMRWRYESAPFVRYAYLEFRSDSRLVGLVPVREQSTPLGPVCRIMDLILAPGREQEVVGRLCNYLDAAGFIFSDFFLIGTYVTDVLLESGFSVSSRHGHVDRIPHLLSPLEHREWTNTVNFGGSLAKSDPSWRDPGVIYFTKADSDRDWPTQYDMGTDK